MRREKKPESIFLHRIVRVDEDYDKTWFAGYDESGSRCLVTNSMEKAACIGLDDARLAVESLKFSFGGVWGIRRVREECDVDA